MASSSSRPGSTRTPGAGWAAGGGTASIGQRSWRRRGGAEASVRRLMVRRSIHALLAVAVLAVLAAAGASAAPTPQGLQGGISSARDRERTLLGSMRSDTIRINGFQGRLDDLLHRLAGIQASLDSERSELARIQGQLRAARAHLAIVRAHRARAMDALARQLVANYESTQPDVVTVIFDAHGFSDLLDRVEGLRRIEERNVAAIRAVRDERRDVTRETAHLRNLEGGSGRGTAGAAGCAKE